MPSLALWLILATAVIVIKANRTFHILLILVPLLIVSILWFLLMQMMDFRSYADVEMFNMIFNSLVAGITFLWLFAPKLCRFSPLVVFFLSFALIWIVLFVGIVSYLGIGFSKDALVALSLLLMLALTMLLGFVLTRWRCRKCYGPVRFTLSLCVWMAVVCTVSMIVFYVIAFTIQRVPVPITRILLIAAAVGSVLGICLYVINLPYMILALSSSFFRERFYACLRIKPLSAASKQAGIDLYNEENLGKEIPEKGDSVQKYRYCKDLQKNS
jgi:hypothetical protein